MKKSLQLLLTFSIIFFSLSECQTTIEPVSSNQQPQAHSRSETIDCSTIPNTVLKQEFSKDSCFCALNYYWFTIQQRCCPLAGCQPQDLSFVNRKSIIKYGNFTKGWQSTKGIEIGQGYIYHSRFSNGEIVTELDVRENTQIWTLFRFQQSRKYVIQFDYAFREYVKDYSSLFAVTLDSLVLWQAKANYKRFDRKYIPMICDKTVKGEEVYLSFIGEGVSDGHGAVIADIRIVQG